MKVSYNWLNDKYLNGKLPSPEKVAEALTFHAWEIEGIEKIDTDTILDVKVLPDKAMWALSHRGIAMDLSAILDLPFVDPLKNLSKLTSLNDAVKIDIQSPNCRRFAAAVIRGVKVGPSPQWLKEALESIGQRSINNIVDISNYVMFDLGQPSHCFDARKVGEDGFVVRQAKKGEKIMGLDDIEYTFTENDTVITRADSGQILSIAGLKGGKDSGISDDTTDIIVEVANWDPVAVRKTGQRLRLRTDASSRYENGIVPEMVPVGLKAVAELIVKIAGGELISTNDNGYTIIKDRIKVDVSLAKINSVLGVSLSVSDVTAIIERFGWEYSVNDEIFTVVSPVERTDIVIAEDVIEEVGRLHGYQHVPTVIPEPLPLTEINKRFYYSEKIRSALIELGFSEIFTSSFREQDEVKLANAFAADKGYLRSDLGSNMKEALTKNIPNADLLGLKHLRLFEIGTVFNQDKEQYNLAIGVQSPSGYRPKTDDPKVAEAVKCLSEVVKSDLEFKQSDGVVEFDLEPLFANLPQPDVYNQAQKGADVTYRPFSVYPATSRDIAMWVNSEVKESEIEKVLKETAGELCVRITLFDRFEKDSKVSYAFRLVFQSKEKTLESGEVDAVMDNVYQAVRERGFEVR